MYTVRPRRRSKLATAYRCNHCQKTIHRESNKAWVKSFCVTAGKNVHLVRVAK